MDPETQLRILDAIDHALAGERPAIVATVTDAGAHPGLRAGAKLAVPRDGATIGVIGDAALMAAIERVAAEMFAASPRVAVETLHVAVDGTTTTRRHEAAADAARVMLQLFEPPSRLVIVGGGHVGLAIAELGAILGFGLTVIDDREEFANRERFPMADDVRCGEVGAELDAIAIDAGSYVVLVSRGHRHDETALRHAVTRGAAYVGMIGSRRRTTTVLEHLLDEGIPLEALERVATPIGLDIGAETPEEIAVSILAEIIMLRRGGAGGRLSARRPALLPSKSRESR